MKPIEKLNHLRGLEALMVVIGLPLVVKQIILYFPRINIDSIEISL